MLWHSTTCPHEWATLEKPCKEGRGFKNCPAFTKQRYRPFRKLKVFRAEPKSCPVCDEDDNVDGKKASKNNLHSVNVLSYQFGVVIFLLQYSAEVRSWQVKPSKWLKVTLWETTATHKRLIVSR